MALVACFGCLSFYPVGFIVIISMTNYPFWAALASSLDVETAGCRVHDMVCACVQRKKFDPSAIGK